MPPARSCAFTGSIGMTARVSVTSNGGSVPRERVRATVVPGVPRMRSTTCPRSSPSIASPLTRSMMSPGRTPPRAAGVSSIGVMMRMRAPSRASSAPMPANSPRVVDWKSLYSFASR
jgi:hypothetical protein